MEQVRMRLLVDTNVWVDYYCGWRSGHESAKRFMMKAGQMPVDLLYSVLSSKDVFHLINSLFKRDVRLSNGGVLSDAGAAAAQETAWACLDNMTELACAVGSDMSDVRVAGKHRPLHADYEDDLIIAAAIRSKADVLVTGDEALRRHAPVCAMAVEDAIRFLDTL